MFLRAHHSAALLSSRTRTQPLFSVKKLDVSSGHDKTPRHKNISPPGKKTPVRSEAPRFYTHDAPALTRDLDPRAGNAWCGRTPRARVNHVDHNTSDRADQHLFRTHQQTHPPARVTLSFVRRHGTSTRRAHSTHIYAEDLRYDDEGSPIHAS